MNKCLRFLLAGSLLIGIAGLPAAAIAQQDDASGAASGGSGGRGGRGRGGNFQGQGQGAPPADGSAPSGGGRGHRGQAGAETASAAPSTPVAKGRASGEQFYIISSVDPTKQEVLLKKPTEVTLLMKIGDSTQYVDEAGKPLKLTDLHSGDTVWVTSSTGAGEPMAMHIRKGQMTVAELHAHYLDYPAIK